jgi:hypothetical protein
MRKTDNVACLYSRTNNWSNVDTQTETKSGKSGEFLAFSKHHSGFPETGINLDQKFAHYFIVYERFRLNQELLSPKTELGEALALSKISIREQTDAETHEYDTDDEV